MATITVSGSYRTIESDSMPEHSVGTFPNANNNFTMVSKKVSFRCRVTPIDNSAPLDIGINYFGVGLNGVPFDPATARYWNDNHNWMYEALAKTKLAKDFGADDNNAHLQPVDPDHQEPWPYKPAPDGTYHYHGMPWGLIELSKKDAIPDGTYLIQVGWAADGYPIFVHRGMQGQSRPRSVLYAWESSYNLKIGPRNKKGTKSKSIPPGNFDGTFVQDYRYVDKLGGLDKCNGRMGKVPGFSKATYYYMITDRWPYIPRYWKGQPDDSFIKESAPPSNEQ